MDQLNQILKDPGRMKQVMDLAAGLGLQPEEPVSGDAVSIPASPANEKQDALVHALLPYLHPEHRARLERAIQVARLSRLAGTALSSGSSVQQEEEPHV